MKCQKLIHISQIHMLLSHLIDHPMPHIAMNHIANTRTTNDGRSKSKFRKYEGIIDKLRIDLEKEREEKQELIIRTDLLHQSMKSSINLNRTITDSGELNECANFMNTVNKLPPGQKSPKTGHANIESTVTLPMTSQNSSRVTSPSLDYVNYIHLSQTIATTTVTATIMWSILFV
jgi:hypothetical protein